MDRSLVSRDETDSARVLNHNLKFLLTFTYEQVFRYHESHGGWVLHSTMAY